ncbi:MAG: hypothetical protein HDT15_00195 [Oscillibacter sp.]|nr:hypothetical protein [Oscillibacter sp.]
MVKGHAMDHLSFRSMYWNYFEQLEDDFFSCTPYCEIDVDNDRSYSIKYLQLLLSICSEIDTICKVFCKEIDEKFDVNTCGIKEYMDILPKKYPTFSEEEISLKGIQYRTIQPWKSIEKGYWWVAYNKVKHHRDSIENGKMNYKLANQKNVAASLAALYVLIEYWAAFHFANNPQETQNHEMPIFRSARMNVRKWNFCESFMGQPPWFNTKRFLAYLMAASDKPVQCS